ncbi:Ada metal-binding domain-containing protein [Tsukamurella sp. 8F]|uniref:AlkA N-terminal domain-containing protein n=1 Tax=unclassified Tsukamurella TaxID=2633480 RepID=UPI0023B9284A|nr:MULTISPECIES: AlkA N-terminal domain-containing protein [unclassified Tsukamurella]MDF0530131.1 Ada metal-binding domain-containing protein [Tsukamurella sp. 8J]MDF0586449.1 Ada metal-binding domain-containing protein [Tsukamurella sp. 8F]
MIAATTLDFDSCYRAIASRDPRFDGQFVTAVRTTGIYCRPSCPARTPKAENVSFHLTAASAQAAGYRACRRCLPDAVPGSPRWNRESDLTARTMRLIADGVVDRDGVGGLAARLGYSSRQLSRVLTAELGAGPLALARAHRATTARILIQSTSMPFSDIAFASGFNSIRQFNDTIGEVFGVPPGRLRATRHRDSPPGEITLRLALRPPYDIDWCTWFLGSHAVSGVEHLAGTVYTRTLPLPRGPAVAEVELATAASGFVLANLRLADLRDLPAAVARLRHLLDLDADPEAVDAALAADPVLAPLVARSPGIRLFGSIDGSELLLRTMIGQQISVAAARTHQSRLAVELGDAVDGPGITRAFPTARAVADRGAEILTGPRARIQAIVAAAAALADGTVDLHPGLTRDEARTRLLALRGVGPWTSHYVAMRLLADPDTLLDTDLVIRRAASSLGIDLAENRWSPWASYACMHLWNHAVRGSALRSAT